MWVANMGSLVRATEYGSWLEDCIDEKLCRPRHKMLLTNVSSALLEDLDFNPENTMHTSTEAEASSDHDSPSLTTSPRRSTATTMTGSHFALGQSSIRYADFPREAKELDGLLYNILRMNVKGTKHCILDNVTFPSYIQGMIVLDKHMNISRMDRVMAAFTTFNTIKYNGNALGFMTSFLGAARELDMCQAEKAHYKFCSLMRAFDGKSKTIQYHIAEDFNSLVIDDSLNFHDLLQKYCSMLATVGDGTSKQVNVVERDAASGENSLSGVIICHHCGGEGHKRPDCPKYKQMKKNVMKKKQNDASKRLGGDSTVICHHCNKAGHIRPNCPDLAAGRPPHPVCLSQMEDLPIETSPVQNPVNTTQMANTSALSPDDLQRIVSSLRSGSYPVRMVKASGCVQDERVVLSVCDGIGTAAYILNNFKADITRFIGVELDPVSRTICDNLNPPEHSIFNGVDHSWKTNIFDIKEEDIVALGRDAIAMYVMATPCEDFSKLRLIANRLKTGKNDPREGLRGKKGAVTLHALQIWVWILKHNPNCELFAENVKFDDMKEDWEAVCKVLGEPLIHDAADVSYTRRVRAWWSNLPLPTDRSDLIAGYSPGDPNSCMDRGRTVQPYCVDGKVTARTIGGSWSGDPSSPVADTSVPVIVHDVSCKKAQHLRVNEAERLHGLPTDSTAGGGVSNKDRLIRIGRGWDVPSAEMQLRFSRLVRKSTAYPGSGSPGPSQMAALRSQLVAARLRGGNDAVVEMLVSAGPAQQSQMLRILAEQQSYPVNYTGSVLDSGSSRHLNPNTCVTHADDTLSLTGFDNSRAWTQGNGYLPIKINDAYSDRTTAIDLYDADKFDGVCPILSMGKLIRLRWKFYFESPDNMYAIAPDGGAKARIELGDDDIIRMPHEIRTGSDSNPLPRLPAALTISNPMLHVNRTMKALNAELLHDIFAHRSMEKIYRTLQNTTGYEAVRLPDFFCTTCAETKAKARGLRHTSSAAVPVMPAIQSDAAPAEDDYEDPSDPVDDSNENITEIEYMAPVVGRALGQQPVPQPSRFELDKLRPFEIMFCDNKDYDQPVRGGRQIAFILYDFKSTAKFKVDLKSKADNGYAFRKIVAMNGIHKLPYSCRIYSDGCGSMAHVEIAAVLMGLDHAYVPPRMPSLNEAEKICYLIWDDANALIHRHKAPQYLMAEAVSYSMYVDMRTATTANRDFRTPYEIIKGSRPSILKLHRFYTLSYVTIPRQKRKALAKKGTHVRAEAGRLLGFQSMFSSTYRVLLSENRMVHSINVTFDDTNCVHDQPALSGGVAAGLDALAVPMGRQPAAELGGADAIKALSPQHAVPHQAALPPVTVEIEHCDLFDAHVPQPADASMSDEWLWHSEPLVNRPRPSYTSAFMCEVEQRCENDHIDLDRALVLTVRHAVDCQENVDHYSISQACGYLALMAQKNIQWKEALAGDDRDKAIAAFNAERDSLMSTILELLTQDHPEYETAVKEAVSGRYLLDIRRNAMWKCRGVKQGFKEDKTIDGPGFVYYSHVVKLYTIRISLFRPNRGTRRIAIQDVKTAFLQSDKFPPETIKYMKIYNPVQAELEYFRQWGPTYGEYSGNIRWEDTYAPYYEGEGFIRGDNERSVFYHEDQDLLVLVYTDDNFFDGEEDSIKFGSKTLEDRFDCKGLEWITHDAPPTDYIGMLIGQKNMHTYVSMEKYIENCLEILGWTDLKPARVPMTGPISDDSPLLSEEDSAKFYTGNGFLSWLSNIARIDITHTWNRISQWQSKPNESAFEALRHAFRYLSGTRHLQLAAPINSGPES